MFRTDRHKAGANAVQDTRARRETGETSHNDITGEPSRTRGAVEHPYVNLANPMPAALDRVPPSHYHTAPQRSAPLDDARPTGRADLRSTQTLATTSCGAHNHPAKAGKHRRRP